MIRPWFIGEAPSRSTSRPGGAPLVGESGHRLARWAGLSPAEFRARAGLYNLFQTLPSPWDRAEAVRRATALRLAMAEGTWVLLLGERVAAAFGHRADPWVWEEDRWGCQFLLMPHPSGLNHHWNDPAHVRHAEQFLHRLFGTPMPEAQAPLL